MRNLILPHSLILPFLLIPILGCTAMKPLPDQASMDAPSDPKNIITLPEYPTPGKKYLVERDGDQEIWVVKDDQGSIDFLDPSSQRVKLSIKLGPCFSFAKLPNHDFGAIGKPAYHTVPPDCRVWDGRTWTQIYHVQVPALSNPCAYAANRRAKVTGSAGERSVATTSNVEITGPGVRGGYAARTHTVVFSEKMGFFRELAPGYIGSKAIVIREVKD